MTAMQPIIPNQRAKGEICGRWDGADGVDMAWISFAKTTRMYQGFGAGKRELFSLLFAAGGVWWGDFLVRAAAMASAAVIA